MNNAGIAKSVQEVYNWIDQQIAQDPASCDACGKCCNFDAYDHRLFVTSPEMIYFASKIADPKPMTKGYCPYLVEGKCQTHESRFAGCRIFLCTADTDMQGCLSEQALEKFKDICQKFNIDYYYTDLKTALNKKPDRS